MHIVRTWGAVTAGWRAVAAGNARLTKVRIALYISYCGWPSVDTCEAVRRKKNPERQLHFRFECFLPSKDSEFH